MMYMSQKRRRILFGEINRIVNAFYNFNFVSINPAIRNSA